MSLKKIIIIDDFALILFTAIWFFYRFVIGMDRLEFIFSWLYAIVLLVHLILNLVYLFRRKIEL